MSGGAEEPSAYEVLELPITATEEEINKAYKKLALKYHPDKNRNNPKAAEIFQKVVLAHDTLLDPAAKAALDQVLKAKRAAAERSAAMNAEQRRARDELDARERQKRQRSEAKDAETVLQAQLKKLREESASRLEAETERLRADLGGEREREADRDAGREKEESSYVVEVVWEERGGQAYTRSTLHNLFAKYGPNDVILSKKKPGRALVSFHSLDAAQRASLQERGLKESPLVSLSLLNPPAPVPAHSSPRHPLGRSSPLSSSHPSSPSPSLFPSSSHVGPFTEAERRREEEVLSRMRVKQRERERERGAGEGAASMATA